MTNKFSSFNEFLLNFESNSALDSEISININEERKLLVKIKTLCEHLNLHKGKILLNDSLYTNVITSSYSILFSSDIYESYDILLFNPITEIKYNENKKQYLIFSYPDACTSLILKDDVNEIS